MAVIRLGHMHVCTSLQKDNHASTPPLFFTGRMPFLSPNQQRQRLKAKWTSPRHAHKCIGRFQFPSCQQRMLSQPSTRTQTHTHSHTHPFNGPFSRTTQVSTYQKGKTNPDFTEARDSEWQWHQLGQMQVCALLQTNNHTSIPPLCFLQAGCSSCHPTNSVNAL